MTHRRPKSPGSFQDELGGLIERIAPPGREAAATPTKSEKQPAKDTAEINHRLFEMAWRTKD